MVCTFIPCCKYLHVYQFSLWRRPWSLDFCLLVEASGHVGYHGRVKSKMYVVVELASIQWPRGLNMYLYIRSSILPLSRPRSETFLMHAPVGKATKSLSLKQIYDTL